MKEIRGELMNNKFYMDFDKQVFVADQILEEPYIFDLTDQNIKEGFAVKEHMISLFTISEMIGGEITVFLNKIPNFKINNYSRILTVPFEVKTGEVFIYSHFDDEELSEEVQSLLNNLIKKGGFKKKEYKPKRFTLENGRYDLYFAIKGRKVNPDTNNNKYEMYFVPNKNSEYKCILRDEW
jgi:hypothetical protein